MGFEVQCSDIFWSLVRITITGTILYFSIAYYGVWYGLALGFGIFLAIKIVISILLWIFGLEAFKTMDELFMVDTSNNRSNITAAMTLDKF